MLICPWMFLFSSLRGTWSISEMLFTACAPVYSRTSGESLAVDVTDPTHTESSRKYEWSNHRWCWVFISSQSHRFSKFPSAFCVYVYLVRLIHHMCAYWLYMCPFAMSWFSIIFHIVPKTATRDSPFHRSHGFGRPSVDNPSLKADSRGNEKWPVKTCIDWFVSTKLIYQIGYTPCEFLQGGLFVRNLPYLTNCTFPALMRECDIMCWTWSWYYYWWRCWW